MRFTFLLSFLASSLLWAAVKKEAQELSLLEENKKALSLNIKSLNQEITVLTKAYQKYSNAQVPATSLILGQSRKARQNLRAKLIRNSLNALIEKRDEVVAEEQETIAQIHIIEFALQHKSSKSSRRPSLTECKSWPINLTSKSKLIREFGQITDKESKVSWQHPGWLIESHQTPIIACSAGKVVYAAPIPGRGFVVIVEHDTGFLATYAHLEQSNSHSLQVGSKLKAGSNIGSSTDKFYFEIRKNGVAVDPQKVFSKNLISERISNQ
ncbi:M23 family metallopeptidase [bacterium]|nr:M23 family metallopeptidase [bacterium]